MMGNGGYGMVNQSDKIIVNCKVDCGNAPKKKLLKDVNVAFVYGDRKFLKSCVTDDFLWDIVGDRKIQGENECEQMLLRLISERIVKLTLDTIITHGKVASVNGIIQY